jgi:hypothetical protein
MKKEGVYLENPQISLFGQEQREKERESMLTMNTKVHTW